MISYGNPICPVTGQRAILFCCSEGCNKPAFACAEDCLFSLGHFDNQPIHQTKFWSDIAEPVRLALELPLSKEELHRLESQQKQLKIIADELK